MDFIFVGLSDINPTNVGIRKLKWKQSMVSGDGIITNLNCPEKIKPE